MSDIVKRLAVGNFFLQYTVSTSKMCESLYRVLSREDQEDGNVIVKCWGFTDSGYSFTTEFRTISSEQASVKVTPISQHEANNWMANMKTIDKLNAALQSAIKARDKAALDLDQINQYFFGEDQHLIEGEAV